MSGIKENSLAEPQAAYIPSPTELPPQGNINLLALAKYAATTGKDISKMTLEEVERFKVK